MLLDLDGEKRVAALRDALTALTEAHKNGFAHGDCRLPNVLVRPAAGSPTDELSFEVKFVDFDWSGLEGEAMYPPLMSELIQWPYGAKPGGLLATAHDVELLQTQTVD